MRLLSILLFCFLALQIYQSYSQSPTPQSQSSSSPRGRSRSQNENDIAAAAGTCLDGQAFAAGRCRECSEIRAMSNKALEILLDEHNGCQLDSECELVNADTGCKGSCPTGLNKAHRQAFADGIAALNSELCSPEGGFVRECGYMTPMCLMGTARCIHNKCQWSPNEALVPVSFPM